MREYILTLLTAAAVTYLLTPLVRRVAVATGTMHAPRDRDVHVVRTPLLGGVAMYGGLAAALLVAQHLAHLSEVFTGTRTASGLLLAGGLVVIIGIVDDRWGMSALSKLAGQVAAAGILVWSGTEIPWIPTPGSGVIVLSANQGLVLTILVVVVTINAVNFIDGLDGLAAGIVCIAALAFFAYSYTLLRVAGVALQSAPALAAAIVAGICIGFLPHNFYPARIFMGDTGAMLLGLLLAYGPISSTATLDPSILKHSLNRFPTLLPILLPAAVFLIPYADLLLAVARRTRAGQSPFAPDKKHLHHRLLNIGHSHRKSVLLMYLWAALFAVTVVWLSVVRTKLLILAAVTLAGMLVLLLVSVPSLRPRRRFRPAAPGGAAGIPVVTAARVPVMNVAATPAGTTAVTPVVNAAGTPVLGADVAGAPPGRTGAPPGRTGAPPGRTGAPPDRTGAPPDRTGAPPDRTGAPPGRTGAPRAAGSSPNGAGTPPNGAGAPAQQQAGDPATAPRVPGQHRGPAPTRPQG